MSRPAACRWRAILVALACLKGGAKAAPDGFTVREVVFEVERAADGARYPVPLRETYVLEASGQLRYHAYFSNLPIDLNHVDGVDWGARGAGTRVFLAAAALAREGTPGLRHLRDDEQAPAERGGVYTIGLTRDHADSTACVSDRRSPAWARLDREFQSMVAAFERATGRPLRPAQLPQAAAAPTPAPSPRGGPDPAALEAVVAAANRALDASYARFARTPDRVAPPHAGPWVSAGGATIDGDAQHGFTIRFTRVAPAGFEYHCEVRLAPGKRPQVVSAQASFSPD